MPDRDPVPLLRWGRRGSPRRLGGGDDPAWRRVRPALRHAQPRIACRRQAGRRGDEPGAGRGGLRRRARRPRCSRTRSTAPGCRWSGPDERGRGATSDDDAMADTDALVTTAPGVTLVIMVADCVPLALVDPVAGVLAAVHAGWRGTGSGVAGAAITAMRSLGAAARARPGLPRAGGGTRPVSGVRRGAPCAPRRRRPGRSRRGRRPGRRTRALAGRSDRRQPSAAPRGRIAPRARLRERNHDSGQ